MSESYAFCTRKYNIEGKVWNFQPPLFFNPKDERMLSEKEGRLLLKLARGVIESHVKNSNYPMPKELPDPFSHKRGVFCTIHKITSAASAGSKKRKELRGCIGVPYPEMPLIGALESAAKSACHDPRFPVLRENELKEIQIEVSVLTEPEPIDAHTPEELLKALKPREDGIIVRHGFASSLFLPQVWEQLPDKEDFLRHLCMKAGLRPDAWKDEKTKIFRFYVQAFEEE